MLRNAPKFYELAKRIVKITEGCIFVAHNANFDYRVIKMEFERLGFEYERETLCTVELSKLIIPGHQSYSLGKLTRALGIPVSDRHRASGDAMATVKLFKLLLAKDTDKRIVKENIRKEPKFQIEPRLKQLIGELPSETGVYYFHKENGDIIYIGKSKNIKHRVNQHFTSQASKSKKIQLQVTSVTYEITGSELVALLKESAEIKHHKPVFNRAQRRTIFTHGLVVFEDENGYLNLQVKKLGSNDQPLTTFSNINSAKSFINKATEQFKLCQKLTGSYKTTSNCFNYTIKECDGACIKEESVEHYNKRVKELVEFFSLKNKSMVIIDKGRAHDERSAVLIEEGLYQGFGFFDLNYQINNPEILSSLVTPMQHNRDVQHIIQTYLRKNKRLKIINLPPNSTN